ncbi:MAG TPA: pirin family protein [Thermoanaerobaculia bacterium]|nr:pirin family protein [Thermoanaerobaculia bacterium]
MVPVPRTIRTQYAPARDDVGELVTRRPQHRMEQLNPFLFINHHGPQVYPPGNRGLPFGPHPHRGFETVTFIVEGAVTHRDSAGHESTIGAGGVQWMTAGRGIEHSETSPREFLEKGGALEILQLWINLPARFKMAEPRYIGLQREAIPSIAAGDAVVGLISGSWEGVRGPVDSLTGVVMATIELPAGARITLPAPRERRVFFYVVRGEVNAGGEDVREFHLAGFDDDGDAIEAAAVRDSLLIFGHADPLAEPIAHYGPFVMNTRAEILQALHDYME